MTQEKVNVRRSILVDPHMQLSIVFSMVGVLLLLSVAYAISVVYFSQADTGPTSSSVQRLGLLVTGIYFLLSILVTSVVGVIATHRVAGPALVIERAVRALRVGDYDMRLSLRRRDYLKPVATELAALREELVQQEAAREALLAQLQATLPDKDYELACDLIGAASKCPAALPQPLEPEPGGAGRV